MKILLAAAAIIVGCASPLAFAQTAPAETADKPPAREVVTKDDALASVGSVDEKAIALRPLEPDPRPFVSVEAGQASLKEQIAATKFDAAKTDGLSSLVGEGARRDAPFSAKQGSSSSDWHFAFAPYLFAAGISGSVGARGRVLELDANFSGSVWDSLDLGLMGAFEVRKGRLISLTDFMWIKLSQERDTPGPFYSTAKLGVNFFMLDPEVGYRFVDNERGSLDVLGGVRIWSVETNLNVTTGVLPGFDVSQRKTWAAPVVGLRGTVNLTSKFFLTGKFDIGGAGIGADLTTQLFGAAGYRVHKNVALLGGYRWLQVDYDDEEGFLFDTKMQGFMFGAKFSW